MGLIRLKNFRKENSVDQKTDKRKAPDIPFSFRWGRAVLKGKKRMSVKIPRHVREEQIRKLQELKRKEWQQNNLGFGFDYESAAFCSGLCRDCLRAMEMDLQQQFNSWYLYYVQPYVDSMNRCHYRYNNFLHHGFHTCPLSPAPIFTFSLNVPRCCRRRMMEYQSSASGAVAKEKQNNKKTTNRKKR